MRFSYQPGSTPLDGFTIERGIGVGGFGEVYFAISTAGKNVALKKIQRNLDIELRGVKQCINLKHVNLISLWDIRTNEHDENWVVMEYVPGPSLRDVVESYPQGMPEEEFKRWFLSTASGVAYLHEKEIVHRDLKPGNIFLDEDSQVVKIGDYGLSKFISTSRRSGHTESVGTFHYMAPEIGRGVYGKEIDIYAMGIILFEMLTGDVPFNGESTQEIIMKHLTDDPDVDRVPPEFRDVVRGSLMKDPDLRYHSVPAMLADMPWPEVAENCQKIISHQSVGPLVTGVGREREYATSFRASPHKSTHVRDSSERSESQNQTSAIRSATQPVSQSASESSPTRDEHPIVSRLPPVIASSSDARVVESVNDQDGDIVFGPLTDTSNPGVPTDFHNRGLGDRQSHSTERELIRYLDGIQNPNGSSNSMPSQPAEEPIARVVQSGLSGLGNWWINAQVSTPLKLFLLIVAGIVVVKNSEWLLPLAIGLGVVYLVYYAVRRWILQRPSSTVLDPVNAVLVPDDHVAKSSPRKIKKPTKRELKLQTMVGIRNWLRQRPMTDRVIELLGSLLVAALACLVFNLLGLAVGGSILDATIESWAVYAWLTLTSVVASWLLLIIGKFLENRVGENLMRRFLMLATGFGVGAIAFLSANVFSIDLADSSLFDLGSSEKSRFALKGLPMLPAYLIFFTGLFGILRWWIQTDPIRSTRLSLLSVSLCLIWASVFSHLLDVPMTPNCILAVVISISVQLAAPWLSPEQRTAICLRAK